VPSSRLIVLNPVIITDQQIDIESRINVCRDHAAVLSLDCFVCIQWTAAILPSRCRSTPVPYVTQRLRVVCRTRNLLDCVSTVKNLERSGVRRAGHHDYSGVAGNDRDDDFEGPGEKIMKFEEAGASDHPYRLQSSRKSAAPPNVPPVQDPRRSQRQV
jgi:hypothetical protein